MEIDHPAEQPDRQPTTSERALGVERFDGLAQWLGESAETTQAVHALNHLRCKAFVAESEQGIAAAIVQLDDEPTEPQGYGNDARQLHDLLLLAKGWDCVLVAKSVAHELGRQLGADGAAVRYYDDVQYELKKPAIEVDDPAVRLLTSKDEQLLSSAPKDVRGAGFGSVGKLLKEGIVAAALVEDEVVAIAHTSARSGRFADIGVHVLPSFRGRGFATASASLVARQLQANGEIPVWSTGEDNFASQRIAEKLGFEETGRRTYVVKR